MLCRCNDSLAILYFIPVFFHRILFENCCSLKEYRLEIFEYADYTSTRMLSVLCQGRGDARVSFYKSFFLILFLLEKV